MKKYASVPVRPRSAGWVFRARRYNARRNMNMEPRMGQMAPVHGAGATPARSAANPAPSRSNTQTRQAKDTGRWQAAMSTAALRFVARRSYTLRCN